MPATTGQVAPAQEAGRAQPQTTIEPPGGPFIRHSQSGRRLLYDTSGVALGGLITTPVPATPGYLKGFRIRVAATGGSGSSTAAVSGADSPQNAVSLVTVKDAFGTVLISGPGFECLKLIQKYGGQWGLHNAADPNTLPSFSQVASTGNFQFCTYLPFEFAKGYGVISGANASLLPQITWQLNTSSMYGTAPSPTAPTVELWNEGDFYWLPEGAAVEPPGLGTTAQWILQQATPTIGSASNVKVSLPRLGGFLTTLIFIMRDSTGVRIDPFASDTTRFRILLDGVPIVDTLWGTFKDDMQIQAGCGSQAIGSGGFVRDTGVFSWTRKTSLNQENNGLLDTGETFLSTNPGTLVEVESTNWGTISNTPAVLNVLACQVVPSGSLIQGLPEL